MYKPERISSSLFWSGLFHPRTAIGIAFFGTQLPVQLADCDGRGTPVIILNLFEFLLCMGIWVRPLRSVGFVYKRGFSPIKTFTPPHKRRFRDLIAAADETNVLAGAIQFYSMKLWRTSVLPIVIYEV